MKILMVLERDFPPDLRVENEIKSLIKSGHQLTLASYTLGKKDQIMNWEGCTVYKFAMSKFIYKSSVAALKIPIYHNFWKKRIVKIIQDEKPDAIHIHDLPLAKLGSRFKAKYQLKYVLDLHENWPAFLRIAKHTNTSLGRLLSSNLQWEKYEITHVAASDQTIVVVDEAKERLSALGIPDSRLTVVSNLPVLSDFEGLLSDSAPLSNVLFYAGGIEEHRGLQTVIQALPEIVDKIPSIQLWILGKGNYGNTLKELALELGVTNHVVFCGHVSYQEVLSKLMQCSIALIPHLQSEHTNSTIPHKLFQYMFASKAVISSDCSPIKRILDETGAGKTYPYNSPSAFARIAIELCQNPHMLSSMGAAGKEAVLKKYNWEAAKILLERIYTE